MIPKEVIKIFEETMGELGIEGEPILLGRIEQRYIYGYKLIHPMCLGRVPRIIEENGKFHIADPSEWDEIQQAIADGVFDS